MADGGRGVRAGLHPLPCSRILRALSAMLGLSLCSVICHWGRGHPLCLMESYLKGDFKNTTLDFFSL